METDKNKSYIKFNGYYLVDKKEFEKVYDFTVNKYNTNYRLYGKGAEEYKIWKRKVIADYYADSYITVEEMTYDIDGLRKLNQLRLDNFISKKHHVEHDVKKNSAHWSKGTPIYFSWSKYSGLKKPSNYFKDTTYYKGEIEKVHSGKKSGLFDIRVSDEIIRDVPSSYLTIREEKKKDNIDIPIRYKEMSTNQLLYLYRETVGQLRGYVYYDWYDYPSDAYKQSHEQNERLARILKAELSNREHIPRKNKREAKKDRQLLAKMKR